MRQNGGCANKPKLNREICQEDNGGAIRGTEYHQSGAKGINVDIYGRNPMAHRRKQTLVTILERLVL